MSQTITFTMIQSFKTGMPLQNRESVALKMIFVSFFKSCTFFNIFK